MDLSDVSAIFGSFRHHLNSEQELRNEIIEIVKYMEEAETKMITLLEIIHKSSSTDEILSRCKDCREIIKNDVRTGFDKLSKLVDLKPISQQYRYYDNWMHISQSMSFIIALIVYLESGTLASYEDVAKNLGIQSHAENGFHLELEYYLMGLLKLATELSRLAVNSVIIGNYKRPIHISQFVNELHAGFRMLNLKNDPLRKRFDALKYDVKKIQEVVYDLSIRGLKPAEI